MTLAIIQARMGSTRLPNKVLMEVGGVSLLEYEIRRVRLAKTIDKIVVATTTDPGDDRIVQLCASTGVDCTRGSVNDVLDRYWQCAQQYPNADVIVRITGDCPLIDPEIIDHVIDARLAANADYASNVEVGHETFPDGMDIEVFTRAALETAAREATLPSDREHVTPYIRNQEQFSKTFVAAETDHSNVRLTVDTPADFEVVRFVIEYAAPTDGYMTFVRLLEAHPEILSKNSHIARNEGYVKSLSEDPGKT
ncbi:glycosyltransferase family protein [Candidatus Uhrbacteria bacterium]|nr:glycosyltransferase family protein [Candidatus Uhrbacteria bacterium]